MRVLPKVSPPKAIFTTTGMQIIPYRPTQAGMILNARSVWIPGNHGRQNVTAFVMKDQDGTKRLVTYKCHPTWMAEQIPGITTENMMPNRVEEMVHPFTLNADVLPNEIQASAAAAVLDNNFRTAFFNMPTGSGKTLLAVYITSLLNCKAWAMCYRTIVLKQWKSTMERMTTFDIKRIKIINSSDTLMKMAIGDWPFEKYDMYVSTPMLLVKFANDRGLDLLNEVFNNCGIGVTFYDEAHKNIGNICKINGLTNVERTYYLSADFEQASPDRTKLYYKMFGSVPIIKPKTELAQNLKYTDGIVVRYNTHPSFNDIEGCFGKFGFSPYRYMDYQLSKGEFYRVLEEVLDAIRRTPNWRQYKILILCNLIEHTNILKDWLINYFNIYSREDPPKVVRYHSEMPNDEKDEALATGEVIMSTHQSMGVGVDLKMIRHVISLAPVNPIEDNQAAGRARALPNGETCFYYIFQDDGFRYTQKRLPSRLMYLQEQKIKQFHSIKYS